jgi:hypothetical protein
MPQVISSRAHWRSASATSSTAFSFQASTKYEWVTPEWAHRWPVEEIWAATATG